MNAGQLIPLGQPEPTNRVTGRVVASVLIGSALTLLPFVASFPLLPPFGLLMMLAWRLHRQDAFAPWAPALLGLADDLLSGQPLGSAMLLWTLSLVAIDVIDTRLVQRNFWQDWLIASGAIAFCMIGGRLIASPFGAHVDTLLLAQIIATAALYPLASRLTVRLDRKGARA